MIKSSEGIYKSSVSKCKKSSVEKHGISHLILISSVHLIKSSVHEIKWQKVRKSSVVCLRYHFRKEVHGSTQNQVYKSSVTTHVQIKCRSIEKSSDKRKENHD